ncbi:MULTISPECIES: papain-like cysteine protease family protein [Rhizobium]|uniref:papain-like cysteine protease family protein n=1 Tax=Rhizobium TaxID=379 RepID=UPI00039A2BC8|nr:MULTISPECIES: papain-like cysteine protease family protein [Rhizobium]AVC45598.1 hypothetical protein RLV_1711 [Rhizobium leguminosarum bv. viciae]MBX5159614.1 hypothetical protein [Rhizobium sp. NZLR8]TCA84436.1 hypothetical protein E0H74_15205 [Rhizobium leguminosarum bv. viciae]TCA94669.1 hypothetical protein E0H76_18275 [Rhizobium leguminosarum bv. viciae]
MKTWPAGLTRAPLTSLFSDIDVSLKLEAILDEGAVGQQNSADLPFHAQTQNQSNWCWSAVATSIGLFYGTGNWTQCGVATEQVNSIINPGNIAECCLAPITCNVYGYVYFSLKQVRSLDYWSPTRPTPVELYERLFHRKEPVCLRIRWNGGGNAAHFTTIKACTDPSDNGPFIVSTSDTLEGFSGTTLPYDEFPRNYHGGGEWTDTFFTSGRFGSAITFGSSEFTTIDMNDNGYCVSLGSRGGSLFCAVGKVDFSARSIKWIEAAMGNASQQHASIGIDNSGNCLAVYSSSDRLYLRSGQLDANTAQISWAPERSYAAGACNSIAMLNYGVCLEAHVNQEKLYTSLGWLLGDGGVEFSEPQPFGNGEKVSISAAGEICVELHSGVGSDAGRLYCTPGKIDVFNSKIKWGISEDLGIGELGDISLNSIGQCFMSFLDKGSIFSRSGQLNAEAAKIEWFPRVELAKGESSGTSLDSLGRCIQTHIDGTFLYYIVGRQ